jgi:hypothetical protein
MTLNDVQFGIDRRISGDDIAIGNVVLCIIETLCYRECVRGHGTRVYTLEPIVHASMNTISMTATDAAITSPPLLCRQSSRLKKKRDEREKVTHVLQPVCLLQTLTFTCPLLFPNLKNRRPFDS